MAKVTVGFLSVFNHETQEWEAYRDRLEQWFLANDVDTDVAQDKAKVKRRAILLSSLSENTYKLVRDLALPLDLSTLDYSEVIKILDGHFKKTKCGFAERFIFHTAVQRQNETLPEWAARVRSLAVDCNFPAAVLQEALRDRFVLGMLPGPERDKLFMKDMAELTLSKALEVAQAIRCARLGAAKSADTSQSAVQSTSVLKMATAPARAPASQATSSTMRPRDNSLRCSSCGFQGHESSTCKFAKYKCSVCGVKGHLRKVCPKKCVKHNFIECSNISDEVSSDDGELMIANIKSVNGEPMRESVLLNGTRIDFELDCGSPITIIPHKIYMEHFSHKKLCANNLFICAYNGTSIKVHGFLTMPVTYNSKSYELDIYVAETEGVPLLGRDFFSKFDLQISMVNAFTYLDQLMEKYPLLFTDKLGCCKDILVRLTLKDDAKPVTK